MDFLIAEFFLSSTTCTSGRQALWEKMMRLLFMKMHAFYLFQRKRFFGSFFKKKFHLNSRKFDL